MADEENSESKTHQQHPIPQNVLGVEFKLVGGLTLHQFGFLAVFLVIAWIIYSSGLPSFIKTPLAAAVALVGVFLGLVPIQDRSADVWLKNFLLAVSSPTERVWRKASANLDIFFELAEARSTIREQKSGEVKSDRRELTEYLRRTPPDALTPLDLAESEFLKGIRLLQNDVQLPAGLEVPPPIAAAVSKTTEENLARAEVKVAPTLASEVNYSQEKIISLPGLPGKQPKFVTPIQNVRTGRRLRLVKPGEIGLAVFGEKKIISPQETLQKQAEALAQKTREVSQKIDAAVSALKSSPTPLIAPAPSQKETVINLSQLKTEAPVVTLPPISAPSTLTQPSSQPSMESQTTGIEAGKIAYLAEELKKIKAEKETLLSDLEKQKKARLEAETYVSLANEYQKRANEYATQNSQLSLEIKKAQEQLQKLSEVGAQSNYEKENLAKQIKESSHRVEQLAREKSQATDSLINMQKELRELRLKQRFTPTPPAGGPTSEPRPTTSAQGGSASGGSSKLAGPKAVPFVKEANVISGYVRSKTGGLIKNAVVIVKDAEGSPVRALKTSELGQFAITTAVPNGSYTVEVSSGGETFDIMNVDVFGSVLDPLDFAGK